MQEERIYALPAEPLPVRLMNTLWAERGTTHDDLADRDGVEAWLRAVGMAGGRVTAEDAAAARRLRDAVRAAAVHVTHDDRAIAAPAEGLDSALAVINDHAQRSAAERLSIGPYGLVREAPAAPADPGEALARIAALSVRFLSDPVVEDLRACRGPRCVLFFVKDHPRREWCDGACGARARASRYYRRRRQVD